MALNNTEDSDKKYTDQTESEKQSDTTVIPVIEERLKIDKKIVETGRVRITKKMHEERVSVEAPEVHEELKVERVLLNQYIETPPPAIRYEGDTMIIPVIREVVETRLVLVEELHITKHNVQTQGAQDVVLRKEEVIVERFSTDDKGSEISEN